MNKAAAVAHFVAAFQICTVSGVDVKVTTSIQSLQCGSFISEIEIRKVLKDWKALLKQMLTAGVQRRISF